MYTGCSVKTPSLELGSYTPSDPAIRGFVRLRLPGYEPVLAGYYKRCGADGMDNRRQ